MDFMRTYARPFVLVLLAAAFVSALTIAGQTETITTLTNEGEQLSETTEPAAQNRSFENGVELTGDEYTITAQSGDNQTVLVREIVASYMSLRDDSLNPQQALYVETHLVDTLPRNDLIFVGDTIRLSDDSIETVVAQALTLTDQQQAAWSAYL